MQASISCFLSSSTFFLVSFLSGSASPCLALAWTHHVTLVTADTADTEGLTCWIFILWKADEKESLIWKVWLGSISLDLGVLTRIL